MLAGIRRLICCQYIIQTQRAAKHFLVPIAGATQVAYCKANVEPSETLSRQLRCKADIYAARPLFTMQRRVCCRAVVLIGPFTLHLDLHPDFALPSFELRNAETATLHAKKAQCTKVSHKISANALHDNGPLQLQLTLQSNMYAGAGYQRRQPLKCKTCAVLWG